jgi:TRAP transporter TAXI family solute receptor
MKPITSRLSPIRRIAGLVVAASLAVAFAPAAQSQETAYTLIGRGSAGSLSDLAMSVLEEAIKRAYPNSQLRRLPGTAIAVPPRVQSGEAQFGHGVGESVADAFSGERSFAGRPPMTNMRYLGPYLGFMLRPMAAPTMVTLEKSPIKSWADLKGRRVAAGPPDSLTSKLVVSGLTAIGLAPDRLKAQGGAVMTGDWNQAMDMLADGQVDAVFLGNDHPSPIVLRVAANNKLRMVSAPEEVVAALMKEYPTMLRDTIAAGTYDWLKQDVLGVKVALGYIVHKDVPDEVVYNVCKQLYHPDKAKIWSEVVPGWKGGETKWKEAGGEVFIPLHPGTKRCYDEAGIPIRTIAKGAASVK